MLKDSTFSNIDMVYNSAGTDTGGFLYADAREMQIEMTNLVFDEVYGSETGGVFHFRNAKQFTLENVDATDFKATSKGSFFYHDNTFSPSWDFTISIKNGAYNCDSVTAFDWDTVKAEVTAHT